MNAAQSQTQYDLSKRAIHSMTAAQSQNNEPEILHPKQNIIRWGNEITIKK